MSAVPFTIHEIAQLFKDNADNGLRDMTRDNDELLCIAILRNLIWFDLHKKLTQEFIDDNINLMSRIINFCADKFTIISGQFDDSRILFSAADMLLNMMKLDFAITDDRMCVPVIRDAAENMQKLCAKIIHGSHTGDISPMPNEFNAMLLMPMYSLDAYNLLIGLYRIERQSAYIVEPKYPEKTYGAKLADTIYASYISTVDMCGQIIAQSRDISACFIYIVKFIHAAIPIIEMNFSTIFINARDDEIIKILNSLIYEPREHTSIFKINIAQIHHHVCDRINHMPQPNAELQRANTEFFAANGAT
jgi:hypothetical protein